MLIESQARVAAIRLAIGSLTEHQPTMDAAIADLFTGNDRLDAERAEELVSALVGWVVALELEAAEGARSVALELLENRLAKARADLDAAGLVTEQAVLNTLGA